VRATRSQRALLALIALLGLAAAGVRGRLAQVMAIRHLACTVDAGFGPFTPDGFLIERPVRKFADPQGWRGVSYAPGSASLVALPSLAKQRAFDFFGSGRWSPDGSRLAFIENGTLKVLAWPEETLVATAAVATSIHVTWSADGESVLASSGYGPMQRVHLAGGSTVERVDFPLSYAPYVEGGLAVQYERRDEKSADMSASNRCLVVRAVPDMAPIASMVFSHHPGYAVAPDGSAVVATCLEDTPAGGRPTFGIWLWKRAEGPTWHKADTSIEGDFVDRLVVARGGELVAIVVLNGDRRGPHEFVPIVCETRTGKVVRRVPASSSESAPDVAFSPDGSFLLSLELSLEERPGNWLVPLRPTMRLFLGK
jgi:hypothetical protein